MSDVPERLRPLRADAERNRGRLLEAARTLFTERGLDVPVEDVARAAGVGVATLYRRFPTRDDLVVALFEERIEAHAQAAEEALAAADAWDGLVRFLRQAIAAAALDRGFKQLLAGDGRGAQRLAAARARVRPAVQALVERAQAAGALRADVVYEDVAALLMAASGIAESTGPVAPRYWERWLELQLDGLRAARATPLTAPPLTVEQLARVSERAAAGARPHGAGWDAEAS